MTNQDLKKLNRRQLLELLILQTERGDKLEARVEELERELQEKKLQMTEAGSIAEASLRLSGTFEAAQAAADQYLESVQQLKEETAKRCKEMLEATRRHCLLVVRDPEQHRENFNKQVREVCTLLGEIVGKEPEDT